MDVVDLASALIRCPSVTPDEAGCFAILAPLLEASGFETERFDRNGTSNLFAVRRGKGVSVLFNGHCDVVPAGSLEAWKTDPFEPITSGGFLFGRGAADMKGPLAAMVCAAIRFVQENILLDAQIGLLVTSDEEGVAVDGTAFALAELLSRGERFDYAVVGEPTSERVFGDTVKIGRRGSLSARVVVRGVQGHVAYPHLASNPIHLLAPVLGELAAYVWDEGDDNFGPSTLQIVNLHAGTGALNVIPGEVSFDINLRYNPLQSAESVQAVISEMFLRHSLSAEVDWIDSAKPFITSDARLLSVVSDAAVEVTGIKPALGTGGGTSDARFLAGFGIPVCEFGPLNATIHQANECVSVDSLRLCTLVYFGILNCISGQK